MSPVIRPARVSDAPAVLALWRAAGSHETVTDNDQGLAVLVGRDPGALLVAEDGRELVGSVIAGWDGWRGSLYRLAVHPRHRRGGVALALVRAGEERLRALGAVHVQANVHADETAGMGFWAAAGYAHQPTHERFVRTLDGAGGGC